jgi:hypothetical protein
MNKAIILVLVTMLAGRLLAPHDPLLTVIFLWVLAVIYVFVSAFSNLLD